MAAADVLRQCLSDRCCPTQDFSGNAITWWNTAITGNVCKRTTTKFGENQISWTDHDASGP